MLTLEKPKEDQYFLRLGPARGRSPWDKAAQTYEKPKENICFLLKPMKNLRKSYIFEVGLGQVWAQGPSQAGANPIYTNSRSTALAAVMLPIFQVTYLHTRFTYLYTRIDRIGRICEVFGSKFT